MKYYLILFTILLVSCNGSTVHEFAIPAPDVVGPTGPQGNSGVDGKSCSVAQTATGAVLTCTDGTSAVIANGFTGATGQTGNSGASGTSCSVVQTATGASLNCTDGTSATVNNGNDGKNGDSGVQGIPGTGCSISVVTGGANVTCDNDTVFISDGSDGATGPQGPVGQDGVSDNWSFYSLVNGCTSIGSGASIKTSNGCQLKLYRNSSNCNGLYSSLDYFAILSNTITLEVDTASCKVLKVIRSN